MKHWSTLFLVIITLIAPHAASAQGGNDEPTTPQKKRFTETKTFETLHVGIPLVATGLAFSAANDDFKALRDSYCPDAHTSVDDYLQYAPAAAMIGLKAAGVESRSSWGRMLTSDALSVAAVTLITNGLKMGAKVKRPDTGADNSFPSGHTATAFMTATMLHKEYGATSKWYSIGAYTAATATGLMRVVNNRHWVRDILAGAGIGILSTEVGYLLADLVFGKSGINREMENYSDTSWREIARPSMLGLYLGSTKGLGSGSTIGLEGAYFINKYVGFGGRFTLSNSFVELTRHNIDALSAGGGCYLAYPILRRIRVGAKLLAGATHYETDLPGNDTPATLTLSTGGSLEYLANRHLSFKGFFDYDSSWETTHTIGFSANIIF